MAFTQSELYRIKYECGYNLVELGALPYVEYIALFDQVILPWTNAGADTTSSTVVAQPSAPTLTTITLASATGFHAFDRVFIDVDSAQELVTVASVSSSTISAILSKAHTGTYPVTVDGGVARSRVILRHIDDLDVKQGQASNKAGVKRVDEIEFFGQSSNGRSGVFSDLKDQREYWRRELANTLGIPYLRDGRGGGTRSLEVY